MEWNTHSMSLPLQGTSLHRFGKTKLKPKKSETENIFVIIIMILCAALFFFFFFFSSICRLILRHVQSQNVYCRSRLFNLLQAHDRFCLRKSSFNNIYKRSGSDISGWLGTVKTAWLLSSVCVSGWSKPDHTYIMAGRGGEGGGGCH